tara:strand:- start:68 stop:184 length:117 start_codon:yes stop_codon:yes gene_type:complete
MKLPKESGTTNFDIKILLKEIIDELDLKNKEENGFGFR